MLDATCSVRAELRPSSYEGRTARSATLEGERAQLLLLGFAQLTTKMCQVLAICDRIASVVKAGLPRHGLFSIFGRRSRGSWLVLTTSV